MKNGKIALSALAGVVLLDTPVVGGVFLGVAAYMASKRLIRRAAQALAAPKPTGAAPAARTAPQPMRRMVFKTISFRVIVTSLDFASNIFAIGELGPAMGLSAYGLVAGPLFYFLHEMVWEKLKSADASSAPGFALNAAVKARLSLAKTVTYRVFATTTDFTANYVTVRDLPTAAGLTAFGFIVGPFVYYGHEKVWNRLDAAQPPVSAGARAASASA